MNEKFREKLYSTKYEERIVANVDILGFKDLVYKSRHDSAVYEKNKCSLDMIDLKKDKVYIASVYTVTNSKINHGIKNGRLHKL